MTLSAAGTLDSVCLPDSLPTASSRAPRPETIHHSSNCRQRPRRAWASHTAPAGHTPPEPRRDPLPVRRARGAGRRQCVADEAAPAKPAVDDLTAKRAAVAEKITKLTPPAQDNGATNP